MNINYKFYRYQIISRQRGPNSLLQLHLQAQKIMIAARPYIAPLKSGQYSYSHTINIYTFAYVNNLTIVSFIQIFIRKNLFTLCLFYVGIQLT